MPLFPDLFLRDSHFGNLVLKTTLEASKVTGISPVNETGELMVVSQFGKIMHIDTKSIRVAGGSASSVKPLDLDTVATVVISPEESKPNQRRNATAIKFALTEPFCLL
jgi:hypothetical protein